MAHESPDYKKLHLEGQRRLQEALDIIETERSLRANAEELLRKTSLVEFLDAAHIHLHCSLAVQRDISLSTKGNPANATHKLRPERILEWTGFPVQQEAIWGKLQRSDFMHQQYFTSLNSLKEAGEVIHQRLMSSELDLNYFERSTVEDRVTAIKQQLYDDPLLRKQFGLKGSIDFENHANTLRPEEQVETGMQSLDLYEPRKSSRLLEQSAKLGELSSAVKGSGEVSKSIRPRADQFCVYHKSNKSQDEAYSIAAYVVEYKAPHKLTLGYIYEGLDEMDLKEVICCRKTDWPKEKFRRLLAAIITQAFSYMVQGGLEYGYVCTGEAFIFLRVPDDPKTVYYSLAVPQGDVGETTGFKSDSDEPNRLHLTAVGQVLALTLQALQTPPRSQSWQVNALAQLKTWEVVYEDLLGEISKTDKPSSAYRPPRQNAFLRMSPIRLRPRAARDNSLGCHPPQYDGQLSDDDFGPDPDTPSRPDPRLATQLLTQARKPTAKKSSNSNSRGKGKNASSYCTQKCLRGLVEGRSLDLKCPNAGEHGKTKHKINRSTFLRLMRQQFFKTLDTDCTPTGVYGATGVLFKVRLASHGYILAAKATTVDFAANLRQEAIIYKRLRPIQGIHVPVCLGIVDLDQPYHWNGIADLVQMMLLSYGGQSISRQITAENRSAMTQQVETSYHAIHDLGVLHGDAMPRNILWNRETCQVMIIDFERATFEQSRKVLGVISPNRKRKRGRVQAVEPKNHILSDVFVREVNLTLIELGAIRDQPSLSLVSSS